MTLGEKIKTARKAKGLTQVQLAEKINVSIRTVKAYENNEQQPRQGNLYMLARVLRVSIKYLTDETCVDPTEDLEKDGYIIQARELHGTRGAHDVQELLDDNAALFAGGELSDCEKDMFFQTIMEMYLDSKKQAKEKFGRKN